MRRKKSLRGTRLTRVLYRVMPDSVIIYSSLLLLNTLKSDSIEDLQIRTDEHRTVFRITDAVLTV